MNTSLAALLAATLLTCCVVLGAEGVNDVAELTRKSAFIFEGEVKKANASTVAGAPASDRTAVVEVKKVLKASKALAGTAGKEVTVYLLQPGTAAEGQKATFFTNGWLLGDGVAVREVGIVPAGGAAPAPAAKGAAVAEAADPVAAAIEAQAGAGLRERVQRADLIVVGKVAEVRRPAPARIAAVAAAALPGNPPPHSEHFADWREAVIQVESVVKGALPGGAPAAAGAAAPPTTTVVLFPASKDVMWYKAPKFQAGQEGTYLLHRDQVRNPAIAAMTAGPAGTPPAFTALQPGDALPKAQAAAIRQLVQGAQP